MEKRSYLETAAIIAAIFIAAWTVRGEVADNTVAVAELRQAVADNTVAVAELRQAVAANTAAIAELRGALLSHIGGHHHAPVIAAGDEKDGG